DSGPVDSLYLAVREARQALAEAPDDVLAQQTLGEVYWRLRFDTRERVRIAYRPGNNQPDHVFFPPAPSIRRTQTAAAWRNVLKLTSRTDLQMLAHTQLIQLFAEPAFRELHVYHFKEFLRLVQEQSGDPSVDKASQRERLKALEQEVKRRERDL